MTGTVDRGVELTVPFDRVQTACSLAHRLCCGKHAGAIIRSVALGGECSCCGIDRTADLPQSREVVYQQRCDDDLTVGEGADEALCFEPASVPRAEELCLPEASRPAALGSRN